MDNENCQAPSDVCPSNSSQHDNDPRYRRLADGAPVMLWLSDERGQPVFFNRKWLSFTGLTVEDALGDAWVKILHPDDRERCMHVFADALKRREHVELEYRVRRHDGIYRTMLDVAEPQYDKSGHFTGYAGSTLDITERKSSELALRQSHHELAHQGRQIRLLNDLNDNLQVCQRIEETYPILERFGQRLFPQSTVTISLFNESRDIVEPFVRWGDAATVEHVFAPTDCWALRKGKLHTERAEEGFICQNASSVCVSEYMCLPLTAYGDIIGMLHLQGAALDPPTESSADGRDADLHDATRRLALMTADQVALSIANLRLRASLRYQSIRDPLTGLFNRRYLQETLEREIARAERVSARFGIMMIDVDHFKQFNDVHGHEAGDLALRCFGKALKKTITSPDIPCRYGGEEFAVVLPDTDLEITQQRAEALRKLTEQLVIGSRSRQLGQISVSIGVSSYPHSGVTMDDLLSSADSALYEAKQLGRNCVRTALEATHLPTEARSEELEVLS